MDINTKGIVLSATSKPYEFDGRKGVSHKIRVAVNGEIYICNSDEKQVKEIEQFVGKTVSIAFKVVSPKENLGLKVVSFKA